MVAAADRFDTQLTAAGVPNVKNGQQFASTLRTAFGQVRTAFAQAKTQVSQLATNSVPAFRAAAANVRTTLNQADAKLKNLDLTKNAELHDAALKDSTCKALKASP
jgi:phytoene/squalene synthetase